ncbi:hypothetical protein BDW22DRAFT_1222244 [Trametopsis cervina]|nr:hypothetical protein BDW22DRAFT_1222244 [Trametopsis cervina]
MLESATEVQAHTSTERKYWPGVRDFGEGEMSMDLDTSFPQTEMGITERPLDSQDADPLLVPLPLSPDNSDWEILSSPPNVYDRPPTPYSTTPHREVVGTPDGGLTRVSDERLKALEEEVEGLKGAIAERDEMLVDLQRLVNELRVQLHNAGFHFI